MKSFIAWVLVLAAYWTVLDIAAHAATYNFYFNNTEQGDNSTSTPSVTVTDGKVEKKAATGPAPASAPAPVAVAPPAPPAPAPAVASVAERSEATVSRSSWLGAEHPGWFRFAPGVAGLFAAGDRDDPGSLGFAGNLGVFFSRYVGLNAFLLTGSDGYGDPATAGGAELELTPVHASIFGIPDLVDVGILAGVSTLYPQPENLVSPHLGARLSINFGDHLALTCALRGNAGYALGEGGIAFRL